MSEPSLVLYRVIYSQRVRTETKNFLLRAVAKGLGKQCLQAVKDIDYRLSVYPQFGEPLRDLKMRGETLWIGTVEPLVVQYIIDEPNHLVFVVVPLKVLPGVDLQ